jgi:hypothetical protein
LVADVPVDIRVARGDGRPAQVGCRLAELLPAPCSGETEHEVDEPPRVERRPAQREWGGLPLEIGRGVVRLKRRDDNRIQCRPLRAIAEDHELERQRIAVLFQELVHALRVRVQVRTGVVAKERELLRRYAREPEGAELSVRVERWLAEHLREPAGAGAAVRSIWNRRSCAVT